jgi:hypothetical protein
MTMFLDVRLAPVGGILATSVAINQGTSIDNYSSMDLKQFLETIQGKHVLIGTHGFNVDRKNGIACLSNWETLLQLTDPSVFVGLLWPGDSIWAHGLDYPEEPKIADEAGRLIAPYIDANFGDAASVSFVSHSLGARVILETISQMSLPVRRTIIMAGAIDDNCLNTEFKEATAKIGEISVLASKKDTVLSELFPLGNFVAGIIAEGHPWWRSALGRSGPSKPRPGNFFALYHIPDSWIFLHGDYLRINPPPVPVFPLPTNIPSNNAPLPAAGVSGWQEAWSAAFSSTRFE